MDFVKFSAFPAILAMTLGLTSKAYCGELLSKTISQPISQQEDIETKLNDSFEAEIWLASPKMLSQYKNHAVKRIQEQPKSIYNTYLLSIIYLLEFEKSGTEIQSLKKSTQLARQAIDLDPQSIYGYLALANIAQQVGQHNKALELITEFEKTHSSRNWRTQYIKAKILNDVGTKSQQVDHLTEIVRDKDFDNELFSSIAYEVLEKIDPTTVKTTIEHWKKTDSRRDYGLLLGRAHQKLGNKEKAHLTYDISIRQGSINLDLIIEDGIILLNDLNNPEKALERFNTAIEVATDKQIFDSLIKADIELHRGFSYLKMGKTDKAILSHIESVKHYSQKDSLLKHLSNKYRAIGASRQLKELLEKFGEEIPGLSMSYALLGEVFTEDLNTPTKALKAYADAITISPERAPYYSGMGLAYYKLNRFESAINVFKIASELSPNDGTAKYNIACMQAILGDKISAMKSLSEALALDPSLINSAVNDLDLTNIRDEPEFMNLTEQTVAH